MSLSTATLGPPGVTLVSSGADIEVSINDPVLRISEFKDVYDHATFNITYWKDGQEEKVWWPFYFPFFIKGSDNVKTKENRLSPDLSRLVVNKHYFIVTGAYKEYEVQV